MLKETISFVYKDKKEQVTRRSLSNYSIVRKGKEVYITGQDFLRGNAIRRFIRNQILAVTRVDLNKDPCDRCGNRYQDNRDFVLAEHLLVTYCLVCEHKAAEYFPIRCLS